MCVQHWSVLQEHSLNNSTPHSLSFLAVTICTVMEFLHHYRTVYPHTTVIPKLHLLEDHMVPWIRQWKGSGFELMGEQGAESIHAEFNRLEIRHRNQRHDRVERLRRVVTGHLTKSSPTNIVLQPKTKHRKLIKNRHHQTLRIPYSSVLTIVYLGNTWGKYI